MWNILLLAILSGPTSESRIAQSISIRWELLSNFYQGKRQTHCALTIYNTGKDPLPSKGWALYFNALPGPQSGATSSGLNFQDLSGCLFRLQPAGDFRGLDAGDSLRVDYTSSDWAANVSDAPEGWYMVWEDQPAKGIPIGHYTKTPITSLERYPGDRIPEMTPELTYDLNQQAQAGDAPDVLPLFPTPRSVTVISDSSAFYDGGPILADPPFKQEAAYLKEHIKPSTGGTGSIRLIHADSLPEEGYRLSTSGGNIRIEASDPAGMFYGIQTLLQLMPPATELNALAPTLLPALRIADQPRFSYRAVMLDVARNFQPQHEILRLLDLMAFCKLNVLHLHLTDDEGWRLDIPGLPELTAVGAKRGHTLDDHDWLRPCYGSGPDTASSTGSGYYTRTQFEEILKYAQRLHIRVIPEIESPGHARAAIKAMDHRYRNYMQNGQPDKALEFLLRDTTDLSVYSTPQYYHDNVMNVALPSVYRFIGHVTEEIVKMYSEAGVPLETIHLGGDEVPAGVWERSPACNALLASGEVRAAGATPTIPDLWYYYFAKADSILHAEGLYTSAWEEAGMRKTLLDGKPYILPNPDFTNSTMQVTIWNNGDGAEDLAYRMANAGYRVVLGVASHLYFDMAYNKSFDEFGYYWATFQDVDKPFSYIPFDYLRLLKEDGQGNPITATLKATKERLTDYGKAHITGLEGCLWGETLRSPADLEYKLIPKVLGLAERAWAPDPAWATAKDSASAAQAYADAWFAFTSTLGRHVLPELEGYAYRIPPPGARIINGKVWANDQFPGLIIRYTINGAEPDARSPKYTEPLTAKGIIRLRAFTENGRGSRVVAVSTE